MVAERPHVFFEHIAKLKDTIDYVSQMPAHSAIMFLSSLTPIVDMRKDFKDYVILVLRKSMFSRELDARLIGVNGFLAMIDG